MIVTPFSWALFLWSTIKRKFKRKRRCGPVSKNHLSRGRKERCAHTTQIEKIHKSSSYLSSLSLTIFCGFIGASVRWGNWGSQRSLKTGMYMLPLSLSHSAWHIHTRQIQGEETMTTSWGGSTSKEFQASAPKGQDVFVHPWQATGKQEGGSCTKADSVLACLAWQKSLGIQIFSWKSQVFHSLCLTELGNFIHSR